MKKKVKVIVETEIEVDLGKTLGLMSADEFLLEWKKSLWDVESLDDIYCHAAEMVASGFGGYNLDGLGKLMKLGGDTNYSVISESIESEIIN